MSSVAQWQRDSELAMMTKKSLLRQISSRFLCGDTLIIQCLVDYLQVCECLSKFLSTEGSYAIEILLSFCTLFFLLCVNKASWLTATAHMNVAL